MTFPFCGFRHRMFLLIVVAALAGVVTLASAQDRQPVLWLPMISRAVAPVNTNAVHSGVATYYYATGAGACNYGASPDDLMVTALSTPLYDGSKACGAYLLVKGPKGEVVVRVVDLCPGCEDYGLDLDLSEEAFAKIANLSAGRVPVTWQVVSPELDGPVAYFFNGSSNEWWTAIQIRNHRNPIATLEFQTAGGDWISIPRMSWNYFVQDDPDMGKGPYTLRVTDWYGNQLIDSGIPLEKGSSVNGAAQFPPWP